MHVEGPPMKIYSQLYFTIVVPLISSFQPHRPFSLPQTFEIACCLRPLHMVHFVGTCTSTDPEHVWPARMTHDTASSTKVVCDTQDPISHAGGPLGHAVKGSSEQGDGMPLRREPW